jgi:branched-chain amino acid aminotransferase
MNGPTLVWLNGSLLDPETASVHWSDHGLTVGDGVFETLELRNGAPFALSRHLRRLRRSADGLGIEAPDERTIRRAVDEICRAWGDPPGRLRVTATSGPGPMGSGRTPGASGTLLLTAGPMEVSHAPTKAVTVPFTRNEHGALTGLKTTSYGENVVALARAEAAGATEALFANTAGVLCEGTGSNVFLAIAGELVTPPLSSGCLAGITRELLLEALAAAGTAVAVRDVAMGELELAEEMFLVSTTRHVQPVSHLDDRPMPAAPGPLTERAARIWHEAYDAVEDP